MQQFITNVKQVLINTTKNQIQMLKKSVANWSAPRIARRKRPPQPSFLSQQQFLQFLRQHIFIMCVHILYVWVRPAACGADLVLISSVFIDWLFSTNLQPSLELSRASAIFFSLYPPVTVASRRRSRMQCSRCSPCSVFHSQYGIVTNLQPNILR